jgi:hypothetical protein
MTRAPTTPGEFWLRLNQAEAERRARESQTREIRSVRPQYRVAAQDEPEPRTPRVFIVPKVNGGVR